ncbi:MULTISPECIES: hypothetical protein [unclassified Lysobacter]|uniref:hypothetical protein n=1 Tax=unclassified Lysobacter TaxID=2635362 RepID=UPI001BEAC328|nr:MULTISPECIES: hypothetical protein [unclassified Lysobacter]MBT2748896.1 hypothetical protein [Lysobacter sp. ISL-42]MBT2753076.1 hypothetical protein [Lysobacter sp. ISL-50]MBT2777245.1 hypothetical protein [Lysobacter sp. ISL-54]MBT2783225.1 hypothetical protein [Lysobacter sp. ISL-52]
MLMALGALLRPLRRAARFRPAAGPKSRHHAAADGCWALLPPLPPGKHRVVVGANYGSDEDEAYGRMIQNFEYELRIGHLNGAAATAGAPPGAAKPGAGPIG